MTSTSETTQPDKMEVEEPKNVKNPDEDTAMTNSANDNTNNSNNERKQNAASTNVPPELFAQLTCVPVSGTHAAEFAQEITKDFVTQMSQVEQTAKNFYEFHCAQQQQLLKKFTADSLRLMHNFNQQLLPIHKTLNELKKPLEDALLNRFIAIHCTTLDELAKNQRSASYASTWGVSSLTHKYNQNHHLGRNAHFQGMDLGSELDSLKTLKFESNDNNANVAQNENKNKNKTEQEVEMAEPESTTTTKTENTNTNTNKNENENKTDSATTVTVTVTSTSIPDKKTTTVENEVAVNQKFDILVQNYLSESFNITPNQTSLVLKFFNTIQAQQKRKEIMQQEQIKKIELQQRRMEQRTAGAQTLLTVFQFLTLDQCITLMEMKDDNIEAATNYGLSTNQMDLFFVISDWRKTHPTTNNANTSTTLDTSRSLMNKSVLVRSLTTGLEKSVIFRCTNISTDGEMTLKGVLDRNTIPLDPTNAKVLHLSLNEFLSLPDAAIIEDEGIVYANITARNLTIVFQVLGHKPPPKMDAKTLNDLMQTVQIPDSIISGGDMDKIKEYAERFIQEQQASMGFGGSNSRRDRDKIEFCPIRYTPQIRELEYELKFDNSIVPVSERCLKSVSHRIDGPVLFQAVMDTGENVLIGAAMNTPLEIYAQVIDDVTHNVVCILLDAHLPADFTVDVANISFLNMTLDDAIKESAKDFDNTDAAGKTLSYKIIVQDKRIVAVLAKIGNEIKNLPFIEHMVPPVDSLVSIASRKMLGVLRSIPTGLIITNNPNNQIKPIALKYKPNCNSKIVRQHWAPDCNGFVDVDVVRDSNAAQFRELNSPLLQAFAVTDIKRASDLEMIEYQSFKEANESRVQNDIKEVLVVINQDIDILKSKNVKQDAKARNAQTILNDCTSNVKKLQELISKFKNRNGKPLDQQELSYVEEVTNQCNSYNRELRALRYEVRMM